MNLRSPQFDIHTMQLGSIALALFVVPLCSGTLRQRSHPGQSRVMEQFTDLPTEEASRSPQQHSPMDDYAFFMDGQKHGLHIDQDIKMSGQPLFPEEPQLQMQPLKIAGSQPIYITVPIYINTAHERPMLLNFGAQQVPLNGDEPDEGFPPTSEPTSHFNRLLRHSHAHSIRPQRSMARKRSVGAWQLWQPSQSRKSLSKLHRKSHTPRQFVPLQ